MNTIDWNDIETQVAKLAVEIFHGYEESALNDFKAFKQQTETDLTQWAIAFANQEITQDEMRELVAGQKNLLELHSLKQWGLSKVALDNFTQGVTNIIVSAISKLI